MEYTINVKPIHVVLDERSYPIRCDLDVVSVGGDCQQKFERWREGTPRSPGVSAIFYDMQTLVPVGLFTCSLAGTKVEPARGI